MQYDQFYLSQKEPREVKDEKKANYNSINFLKVENGKKPNFARSVGISFFVLLAIILVVQIACESKTQKSYPESQEIEVSFQESLLATLTEDVSGVQLDFHVFSPDGKTVAYVRKEGEKEFVVGGGKKGKKFEKVSFPVFSPTGKTFAYSARFSCSVRICQHQCMARDGLLLRWIRQQHLGIGFFPPFGCNRPADHYHPGKKPAGTFIDCTIPLSGRPPDLYTVHKRESHDTPDLGQPDAAA